MRTTRICFRLTEHAEKSLFNICSKPFTKTKRRDVKILEGDIQLQKSPFTEVLQKLGKTTYSSQI